jgi:hypothetical protein
VTDVDRLSELTRAEALRLLGGVPIGRVVFSHRALPAIRLVNHLLVGDQIVILASAGAAAGDGARIADGMIVAYEADVIESESRPGWSVVVVGKASRVCDKTDADRYRRVLGASSGANGEVIAILAEIVTGFQRPAGRGPQAAGD